MARELLWNLHRGTKIAAESPAIEYRSTGKHKDGRQHLTFAQLQRLIDALTVSDDEAGRLPMNLRQLEDCRNEKEVSEALGLVREMFAGASPFTTPVLWRLLLAQACFMHAFAGLVDGNNLGSVVPENIEEFAWRTPSGPSFDSQVAAVESYVRGRLTFVGVSTG